MTPRGAYQIVQPKLVFVEGSDELRIFGALLRHMNLTDVQIESLNGIDNLRAFLQALRGVGGFQELRSLAVVVDADMNRNSRQDQIRNALRDAHLPTPTEPLQLESDGELSVAYLVVPHEGDGTMIEDVCLESVSTDPAMQCVDDYFECVGQVDTLGPRNTWMPKARAHAFLASRDDPTLRLGEAAQNGVWNLESGSFSPLRDLLGLL